MTLVEKARVFAVAAHAQQTDKQGRNYFEHHLVPVAALARALAVGSSQPLKVVDIAEALGYLHDVLEDSGDAEQTVEALRNAGLYPLLDHLRSLTHADDRSYASYIADVAASAYVVTIVKLADNLVNSSSLAALPDEDRTRLEAKYNAARGPLMDRYLDAINR